MPRARVPELAIIVLAAWLTPAFADQYDDAISKAFPGFRILGASAIELEKDPMARQTYDRVRDRPGLAVGKFDDDELPDFAALIRSAEKKPSQWGGEYHEGHLVVCYGLAGGAYDCVKTNAEPRALRLPFDHYLDKVAPGSRDPRGDQRRSQKRDVDLTTKTDSIGYLRTLGSGDTLYAPRGRTEYTVCILND